MKRTLTAMALTALFLPLTAGARDPKSDEPFYRRFLAPGNPIDDRILEYEKKLAASPDSPELHNDFGNLLAMRRFPKEAREQYEIAMKLDKKNFMAPYNMGMVYETEGKTGKAISAYQKSVDRNRGFPPSRFRLGRLYEQTGRSEAAIEQYAKALEIDPAMRDVRRNPLVVDTRLLGRVSVANYSKDMARAGLKTQAAWADEPRFRRVPVDRTLFSEDVDSLTPEPVDRSGPPPPAAPAPIPAGPGQTRPQTFGGRPDAPPPANAQPPTPNPQAPPQDDNPLGLRPRPPLPTPLPQ